MISHFLWEHPWSKCSIPTKRAPKQDIQICSKLIWKPSWHLSGVLIISFRQALHICLDISILELWSCICLLDMSLFKNKNRNNISQHYSDVFLVNLWTEFTVKNMFQVSNGDSSKMSNLVYYKKYYNSGIPFLLSVYTTPTNAFMFLITLV